MYGVRVWVRVYFEPFFRACALFVSFCLLSCFCMLVSRLCPVQGNVSLPSYRTHPEINYTLSNLILVGVRPSPSRSRLAKAVDRCPVQSP